jgi:hypothetical protein
MNFETKQASVLEAVVQLRKEESVSVRTRFLSARFKFRVLLEQMLILLRVGTCNLLWDSFYCFYKLLFRFFLLL